MTVRDLPNLIARPSALSFTFQPGFSLPPTQALTLSGDSTHLTAAALTSTGGSWLTVSPNDASTPTALSVGVIPQGLDPGIYREHSSGIEYSVGWWNNSASHIKCDTKRYADSEPVVSLSGSPSRSRATSQR